MCSTPPISQLLKHGILAVIDDPQRSSQSSTLLRISMDILLSRKQLHRLRNLRAKMPLHLMRKLSFRHKRSAEDQSAMPTVRKASSCKGLRMDVCQEEAVKLPEEILLRILDFCDPFDQLRYRAVSHKFNSHVNAKMSQVTEMDVQKADVAPSASSVGWSLHKTAQVALNIQNNRASIVVDTKWTARDVQSVVGLMGVFKKTVLSVRIDAPIAELMVVSLSALDLNRWYAFQCYMKAMNAFDEMHMDCDFSSPGEVYWPSVQNLCIRSTEKQAAHLARVIDYGVQCNWVLDRRNLVQLRVLFTDMQVSSRKATKHIYHFRCWAGSAGFDHRFEQQFTAVKQVLI